MDAKKDEAERLARAERLRKQIDEMTQGEPTSETVPAPGGTGKRKLTPREFTDKAAAEAARKADKSD